eukprot:s2189_g2.t1
MLKTETDTSQEYWDQLQVYVQAEAEQTGRDLLPAFGGADRSPRIETLTLESEVKIQQLKIHDMVDEANEYVKENLRLKDKVYELTLNAPSAQPDKDIEKVRSELLAERTRDDQATQNLIQQLRDALEREKGDHAITKLYYRQIDAAYSEEVREIERLRQGNGDGADGRVSDTVRSVPEVSTQRGATGRVSDPVGSVPLNDFFQPAPEPSPPPEPSVRGSVPDDATSQSNYSRREPDKVFVPPWPKVQDGVSWQSDVAKGVILAANDGDRAAWQEWLQPALARNPDLDALNDSGGQRFQTIDTKLSIAL